MVLMSWCGIDPCISGLLNSQSLTPTKTRIAVDLVEIPALITGKKQTCQQVMG